MKNIYFLFRIILENTGKNSTPLQNPCSKRCLFSLTVKYFLWIMNETRRLRFSIWHVTAALKFILSIDSGLLYLWDLFIWTHWDYSFSNTIHNFIYGTVNERQNICMPMRPELCLTRLLLQSSLIENIYSGSTLLSLI